MSKMGIFKDNGQKVSRFTCVQCRKQNLLDFRFYPICKKCNKINTKMEKRNNNEHLKEKKEENSRKKRSMKNYYDKHKDLLNLVGNLREVERLTFPQISEILIERGIKSTTGADWNPHRALLTYHSYTNYRKLCKE